MSGTLYIVSTPIGNLSDLSQRTRDILSSVDYILAEDTRVTLKLLNHADIKKKLYSYSEHSSQTKDEMVLSELSKGMNYALVSDAGTPAVSDPGARIVDAALRDGVDVVPIPGPSAVTTLMSVFGKPVTSFHFWGFFPQKKKKQRILVEYFDSIPGVHVFFESPYRILKTLALIEDKEEFHVVVGREMTKKFETFYRGSPSEVKTLIEQDTSKGEFCIGVVKWNTSGE